MPASPAKRVPTLWPAWLHWPGRFLASVLVLAAFAGAFLLVGLYFLFPDDDELARRAEASLTQSLGVQVKIESLHWRLLPAPSVVIEGASTVQAEPIRIQRLLLRPDIPGLLARRVIFKRIEMTGARVPQLSLRELAAAPADREPGGIWQIEKVAPAWFFFRDLTWVTRRGLALAYDGEIDFEPDWRPRKAAVRRPHAQPEAEINLALQPARPNGLSTWKVQMNLGGGTSEGEIRLRQTASGRLLLDGNLQARNIDVAATLATFDREPMLAGRAAGSTTIWAEGDTPLLLTRSLHTRTRLNIADARLLKLDLNKAVRTAGRDHTGQTPLDSLALQLDTQNTAQGVVIEYTSVQAASGSLKATGRGRLSANRQLEAELDVDLVDGVLGLPLAFNGPLGDVRVSVPASAVAGAAIGTAVLPGVGTAVGARLGSGVGKFFGRKPLSSTRKVPPARQRAASSRSAPTIRAAPPASSPRLTVMPIQGGPDR